MKTENKELEEKFLKRTKEHINRLNKYALLLGESFPNHDADKLTYLKSLYMYTSKKDLNDFEQLMVDAGTVSHIKTNTHHPEYWTHDDISGFSRNNVIPCEAYDMPEHALVEMCCDWCAMSEEFGNTPFEWYEKTVPSRWRFTKEQQQFILQTLSTLWK